MSDLAGELAALRAEVERLKAKEAINQQLARYGRGQEWLDVSLMDEVFWDDAGIDFGFFKGTWAEYRPVLMDIEAGADATYHFCGGAQIELEGDDRAYVECYGLAGGRSGARTQIYGGRYVHTFERRGGVWKSARCLYVLDWTIKQEAESAEGEHLTGINRVENRGPTHPLFRRMGAAVTG